MIKYHAFIKVVELGSITKAARELGYSQPGVSHMIDSLEAEMGFPLIARNKEKIVPTEDGKKILACCYQLVKEEDNLNALVQSISGLITGHIYVGGLNSLLVSFVPKVVSTFIKTYSNIEIRIEERAFSELSAALLNGSIDIAFISECKVKGINFKPLFKDPICLLIPEDHPFTKYEKIPPSMLNGCDFIMPSSGWDDTVLQIIDAGIKPNIKYYVASDVAAMAMVKERLGVYVLSRMQSINVPEGLVIREFEGDYARTIGYAVRSLKNISPAMSEFIKTADFIVEDDDTLNKIIK